MPVSSPAGTRQRFVRPRVVMRLGHDRDMPSLERRLGKREGEAHYVELVRGFARTTGGVGCVVIDIGKGGSQDLASRIAAYDLHKRLAAECRAAVRVNFQRAWRDVAVHLHLQHLTPGWERQTVR